MLKNRKHAIFILIAGVILGFILSRQFFLHNKLRVETKQEQEDELALQVSELIRSNDDLKQEERKLQDQTELLKKSSEDRKSAEESLRNATGQYKIISGQSAVKGPGVTINFGTPLDATQITDLVNALRNIGIEALSINGKRITPTTGWDEKTFQAPYKIQAIGDASLLKESLERRGGVMEQMDFTGSVTKQDNIYIPKAK